MSDRDSGFTLIESVMSLAIIASGTLGVATLMVLGTTMQLSARQNTEAMALAVAELERVRQLPIAAAERANGGSLTANVANHFRVRNDVTIRWTIADGPACGPAVWAGAAGTIECTRVITVVGIPRVAIAGTPQVTAQIWR